MLGGLQVMAIPGESGGGGPADDMRALSRLVEAYADDSYFSAMTLTAGKRELTIDGEKQIMAQAPAIARGGAFLPREAVAEVLDPELLPPGSMIPQSEAEALGLSVEVFPDDTILVTAPYQTRRLLAKTAGGTLSNTHGAIEALPLSEHRFALQYETEGEAMEARGLLEADAKVLYAEPDGVLRQAAAYSGVTHIGADAFQEILPAGPSAVTVAVLDSGLDVGHNHFTGRISSARWNFLDHNGNVTDDNGHGTHVAGIVTNASSSNVKVMPLKVLDKNGLGYESQAMEAVKYAADNGAKIINMSFGGESAATNSWSDAVKYATGRGVVALFAATGNGNPGRNLKHYPAAIPGVVAVTASDKYNYPANFAHFGSHVDIGAPGVGIVSAIPGGGYYSADGTSMATPFATAAAALLLSHNSKLSGDDILACLKSTSAPWADGSTLHGAGVINIKPREEVIPSQFNIMEGYSKAFQRIVICPPIPGGSFTYTSGNPAVAAVNQSGGVQALRPGNTTITVTAPGFSAAVPVTVTGSRPPVAPGVTIQSVTMLSPPNITTFYPGQEVYTSGCRVRVTYSDGVVDDIYLDTNMCSGYDPNRLGPQTITVDFSGHKLTFTIKVLPNDIPESLTLRYKKDYFMFPYGEYPGVRWESGNRKVLAVDANGCVVYKGRGSAVVSTVLSLPGGGKQVLAQTKVNVRFSPFDWFVYVVFFGWLWM